MIMVMMMFSDDDDSDVDDSRDVRRWQHILLTAIIPTTTVDVVPEPAAMYMNIR
jgi:hypothetical protein